MLTPTMYRIVVAALAMPLAMASSWTSLPKNATSDIKQFQVNIPKSDVERMYTLMNVSVVAPKDFLNTDSQSYWGTSHDWVEQARDYFLHNYSWTDEEKKINRHPHFTTIVDGDSGEKYNVHFMGLFSRRPDAIPILFVHGWPGSFFEFMGLLDVVKSKYTPDNSPYHVIVPSLPGYPLTNGSQNHLLTVIEAANVLDRLMAKIGFGGGYIAQGGDVGSGVTQVMAQIIPRVKGAHVNFLIPIKPPNYPPAQNDSGITDRERLEIQRFNNWTKTGSGYFDEQATRPATLGFSLQSNPLAILSWIGEKLNEWPDPASPLSISDKLTEISLYWLTNSITSSFWPYARSDPRTLSAGPLPPPITKPFGYSKFSYEIIMTPKKWAAAVGNLTFYNYHEVGGHFAAWEQPAALWSDVDAFIRKSFPRGLGN